MLRCPTCGGLVEPMFTYCPACGTKQPELQPPEGAPPRGKEMPWLLPVLAVIAGAMVLAGVGAYYLVQPTLTPPTNLVVELLQPSFVGSVATVTVGYANPAIAPQAFLVSLSVNSSSGAAVPMPTTSGIGAGVTVTPLGYPFRIDWSDVDYNGKLSTGDTFTITPLLNLPCCLYETFAILRQVDGGLVATVSFSAPPGPAVMPTVSLGPASRGTSTNVYIPVNYVNPATSTGYLYFQLVVGASATPLTPLQPDGLVANVSIGGGEYIVAWYDSTYDGLFDSGDAFNITLVGGMWPTTGTSMGFYLEWYDGTTLASATWTA